MIGQIINCLFAGLGVGFNALLSAFTFYEQLSGIKEQLISAITGIPCIVVAIISTLLSVLVTIIRIKFKNK